VRTLALLGCLALVGCGATASDSARNRPDQKAGPRALKPDGVPCAELQTRQAAHRLARKLVDRVVAPDRQAERETIGIIGESLYATCRQPSMPGVADMARYRPVKSVLAAVQRDFDEEEIAGH